MRKLWLIPFLLFSFSANADARSWAQLALGGGYQCVMLVSNKTAFDWTGEFSLYQGHEQEWNRPWRVNGQDLTGHSGFELTIHGYGTAKLLITGDDTTRAGYLEMFGAGMSSSYDVSVAYFYQYFKDGKLTTSTGSPEADSHKSFYFPVEVSATVNTGIAWAPDFSTSAAAFDMLVSLYLPDQSGVGKLYSTKTLRYTGHDAMFIDSIFPELRGSDFRGYVKFEAPYYICLEVLRMDTVENGFLLTSTPPDWYLP